MIPHPPVDYITCYVDAYNHARGLCSNEQHFIYVLVIDQVIHWPNNVSQICCISGIFDKYILQIKELVKD